MLSPKLHEGSHASFQLGGLNYQGPNGHLCVPPPDLGRAPGNRPWNDNRCCISFPGECQVGGGKKPTGDGPEVQAYRGLQAALPRKGAARRFSKATGQLPRTGAAQPLAAFFTLFLCQRHPWEETWMGSTPRGLASLATGSVYWSVQNRGWAQGLGSWSKPLVVHVVVNGAGAAGPAVAHAAELVSCKRPSAPLLLLPGPAALGPVAS